MGNKCCATGAHGSGANLDDDLRFAGKSSKHSHKRFGSQLPDARQIQGGYSGMNELARPQPIRIRSVQLINKDRFLAEYDHE